MATIKKNFYKTTLEGQPCCVEFLPSVQDHLIIGTYNLVEQESNGISDGEAPKERPQIRFGSIILARLVDGQLEILETVETNYAIFDFHFHPWNPHVLCAAGSSGTLTFFQIGRRQHRDRDPAESPLAISHRTTVQVFDPDIDVTSLAWCYYPHNVLVHYLAVTLSDKSVKKIDLHDREGFARLFPPNATPQIAIGYFKESEVSWLKVRSAYKHDEFAWIVNYMPGNFDIVSGGDDGVLRGERLVPTDLIPGAAETETGTCEVSWANRRLHNAGVTAVTPISTTLLLTGSYDDHIRLVRLPAGTDVSDKRELLAELNLGGGVWRIKIMDTPVQEWGERYDLLVSCMYAGVRIVRLSRDSRSGKWVFEVLARFEEHQSMNYASDYQPQYGKGQERTIVSTSFYDRLFCCWRVRFER